MHNDQLVAVNQGGKRAGSGCAYLEVWHNDIREFLELRRNTGDERRRTHDMNTACWIPDLFMQRVESRGQWTLFRSNDVPDLHETYGAEFERRYTEYERRVAAGELHGETIPALELWKQMLKMLFETGHPWLTFKDPCNVRSPQDHAGVVHSSNLCTEITLNTGPDETAVCNLGSVVLDQHLTADGEIDHAKLRETVRIAVRALDCVIDINFYPTDPAATANGRHRPVGLGMMGLQYALYRRGEAFASAEGVEFSDEIDRGRGVLRVRGLVGPRGRARHVSVLRGLEVGARPASAGHGGPARDRARRGDRGRARRSARLGAGAGEDRRPGHAQLERAGDRADGHDREHHGHVAVHRADVQEPVREVQPVRGLRRAQPVPGARPEGRGPVGRADGRGAQGARG